MKLTCIQTYVASHCLQLQHIYEDMYIITICKCIIDKHIVNVNITKKQFKGWLGYDSEGHVIKDIDNEMLDKSNPQNPMKAGFPNTLCTYHSVAIRY